MAPGVVAATEATAALRTVPITDMRAMELTAEQQDVVPMVARHVAPPEPGEQRLLVAEPAAAVPAALMPAAAIAADSVADTAADSAEAMAADTGKLMRPSHEKARLLRQAGLFVFDA
jgi:hypothetical protein